MMTRDSDAAEKPNDDQSGVSTSLKRPGGLSYLHIPANDVYRAATFYQKVFGWNVRGLDTDRPSFDDGTGHVSGAWMSDQEISSEAGLKPYIYVEQIEDCVAQIKTEGGQIISGPDSEGNLLVATFRDSEGNVLGLWQEAPR
jgi:predicted enzyme related to lactoylglutathione lyase